MSAPITLNSKVRRQNDLLLQPLGDDLVMADPESGNYYGLGSSGKRIWELMEPPAVVAAICEQLIREYDIDRSGCEREVLGFVTDLVREGLAQVV
jgi:hypothetical protein